MDKHIRVTNSVVAFTNGTAARGFGILRMKAILMSGTGTAGDTRGVVPFGLVLAWVLAVPCLFCLVLFCFFLGLVLVAFLLVLFLFFFSSWRFPFFSGVSRGNFSGDNKAAAADLAGCFVVFFFFFLVVVAVVVVLLLVLGVCAVGVVARWFLLAFLILDDALARVCEGLVLATLCLPFGMLLLLSVSSCLGVHRALNLFTVTKFTV